MPKLQLLPCLIIVASRSVLTTDALCQERHHSNAAILPPRDTSRRRLLLAAGSFAVSSPLVWFSERSYAATPANPGEAIRRSAANLPGYGQTDVFYPSSFAGKWKAIREIVASEELSDASLPLTITYEVRFLPSVEDPAVVADRGFNMASMRNALAAAARDEEERVRSFEWDITNPNDLKIVTESGVRTDLKVTKRSTERTDETVSSSEFQRILKEQRGGGPPIIEAHRVLAKWKVVNDNVLEGIEITYDVGGSLGDPLAASSSSSSGAPRVIEKSRIRLERMT